MFNVIFFVHPALSRKGWVQVYFLRFHSFSRLEMGGLLGIFYNSIAKNGVKWGWTALSKEKAGLTQPILP